MSEAASTKPEGDFLSTILRLKENMPEGDRNVARPVSLWLLGLWRLLSDCWANAEFRICRTATPTDHTLIFRPQSPRTNRECRKTI
jgi:hypothetical protein